ncbi:MAG: hypothetical protein V3S51_05870 [Dehalococcoidia bacterium]
MRSEGQDLTRVQIKMLEGEEEAERLANARSSLILTNKRIICIYRDERTSKAAVAFLQDIVSARVKRTRPNKMTLIIGIVLAFAGLIWSLVSGLGNAFDSTTTAVILIADMVLVLACLTIYLTSSGAMIFFRTANDEISYQLGQGDSMYSFINRWLELKDSISR